MVNKVVTTIALTATMLGQVWALDLSGSIYEEVGNEKALDPVLLYAVALAESAYSPNQDGWVSPYVYTLRSPTKPYYEKTKKEATARLKELLKESKSIDVGLMQINLRWHGHRVKRPEDLFDAKTNLRVGADILNERLLATGNNWPLALGQYHSFDPERGAQYATVVLAIYYELTGEAENLFAW